MKILQILLCVVLLNYAHASWLSDVFTGLDEATKDLELKKKITTIQNAGKAVAEKVSKILPRADWVKETKDFLHDVKFKDILEQKSNLTMDEIVKRWNGLLKELNNEDYYNDSKEMYFKIRKDVKNILPLNLYKKWKKEIHSVAKKLQKVVKNFNIDNLKANVLKWEQPGFMKKENLEEEKEMIKDAVEAANKKIKEQTDNVMPLIRFVSDKKAEAEDEKRVEDWLKKKFVKPHNESGHSKWKTLVAKLPLKKLKTKIQSISSKELKQIFSKFMKKNLKKMFTFKKPSKTEITFLSSKNIPFLMSKGDAKKLKSMTPEAKKKFEEDEKKWERSVLETVDKLGKHMEISKIAGDDEKELSTTPMTTKKSEEKVILTGNEDWDLFNKEAMELVPWDEEDDDVKDDNDDLYDVAKDKIDAKLSQSTRAKMMNKDTFTKKLADQEVEWFDIKKKLMSKMKSFGA